MTLITYITRVHFADGVLEEALFSELEVNQKIRPLVILESDLSRHDKGLAERFLGGFPNWARLSRFQEPNIVSNQATANHVAAQYERDRCDILIAFGAKNVIDLAKLARVQIAHGADLRTFSIENGGSRRISTKPLPELYAVPTILGFGSAVSAFAQLRLEERSRQRLSCRKLVPTVTICDPTLTLGASPEQTASAGADAISRCLETFISPNYNPPADGIAFDGLRRAVQNLKPLLEEDSLDRRREMMAACLNSSLALQKGLGITRAMSGGLEIASGKKLDSGSVSRLLLPNLLQEFAKFSDGKEGQVKYLFSSNGADIGHAVAHYFDELPLPKSLAALGVEEADLAFAANLASDEITSYSGLPVISSDRFLSILSAVHK